MELYELKALQADLEKEKNLPKKMEPLNLHFRDTLLRMAKNRFLTRAVETIQRTILLLGPSTLNDPKRAETAIKEHRALIKALQSGDADKAETIMSSHLQNAQRSRIRQIQGSRLVGSPVSSIIPKSSVIQPGQANQLADVLVIGGGNAALCAAISAAEAGATVVLLERSPKVYRGGNSRHVRNFRCAHSEPLGVLSGEYSLDEFYDDLSRVTKSNTDEAIVKLVMTESNDCIFIEITRQSIGSGSVITKYRWPATANQKIWQRLPRSWPRRWQATLRVLSFLLMVVYVGTSFDR